MSLSESIMQRRTAPSKWLFLLEGRAAIELGLLPYTWPILRKAPRGDGHPVLVLPGFLADSVSTVPMRSYLKHLGYDAHRWRMGRNTGFSAEKFEQIIRKVRAIAVHEEQPVSLVGWSLGGVFAREIAREIPDSVRQVITLGSPFRATPEETNITWLYEVISGHSPRDFGPEFMARMAEAPPVPCTAIYSRTDGVVAWQATIEESLRPDVENVEVGGAHCGLGINPKSLWVIADRLAQPAGDWRPFRPKGWLSLVY